MPMRLRIACQTSRAARTSACPTGASRDSAGTSGAKPMSGTQISMQASSAQAATVRPSCVISQSENPPPAPFAAI